MNLESKTEYGGYYLNWAKAKLIPLKDLGLINLYFTIYFYEEDEERYLNELVKLWWKWMKSPNSKPKKCPKCIREIEILFPIILKQRKNDFIEPESN